MSYSSRIPESTLAVLYWSIYLYHLILTETDFESTDLRKMEQIE